jgi:hypothetical protein
MAHGFVYLVAVIDWFSRRVLIPIEGAHQNEMIAPAVTE